MERNHLTKYFRIKKDLLRKIQNGVWAIDYQLPTEAKLQERYRASRGTVRRALLELQMEGYIRRKSGQGTFVLSTNSRIQRDRGEVASFSHQVSQAGFQPSSRVLVRKLMRASEAEGRVCEGFNISPEAEIVWIKRLRLANGIPLAIQSVFLLPARCPGILEERDLSQLMKLYRERYGVRLTAADEILRVTSPRPKEAKLLQLAPHSPVVVRDQISFDQRNSPFEVLHSVEVAERFEYRYRIVNDATQVTDHLRKAFRREKAVLEF